MLSFFTVDCSPCRRLMEAFQSLYAERGREGLAVYGLVIGRDWAPVEEARAELGLHYPILSVGRDTLVRWGAGTIVPLSFLVNREGRIVRRYPGADESLLAAVAADVNALLAGKPLGTLPDSSTPDAPKPSTD